MTTIKIISLPGDGTITSDKKFDWGQSGTDGPDVNTTGSIGKVLASHRDSINRYFRTRAFLSFDTSVIPTGATILSARLLLWGRPKANAIVVAQKGTQSDTLGMSDYTHFTGPEYGHTAWQDNQFNTIVFNAQGLADINRTGLTKICCREYEHDFLNVPPLPDEEFLAEFYTSEIENADLKPCLEIQYGMPEVPECSFNIQNTSGQAIVGADVSINCQGTTVTGQTDNMGCITLQIPFNTICEISVTKDCYKRYLGKIMTVRENLPSDPSKNFTIKVIDVNGIPLVNANVAINSGIHTNTGITNANGIYEGRIETDYMNELTIGMSGFSTYQLHFNKFPIAKCQTTGIRLVSVITMT